MEFNFKLVLGVDMSKLWFNYCMMNSKFEIVKEGQIENKTDAIFAFLTELLKLKFIEKISDLLLVMEHTGIYTQHLNKCWLMKGGSLSMVHAPKISEELGGKAGFEEKTDAKDARRIAEFAFRFSDKLKIWKAQDQTLLKLQAFQRQRDRLIGAINLLEVPEKESLEFDSMDISQSLAEHQKASLEALKQDLENLEKSIKELIETDDYLKGLFRLINSVEGVGPVTAREIIIATGAFTEFTPSQAKAFAKYVGVIPNKTRSGTSVKKKDKTGKRCHKILKTLLTMAASSLINSKQELGKFYKRKVAEGKNPLSVINAMRNKIILRIFAVVRNQSLYEKNLNIHSC